MGCTDIHPLLAGYVDDELTAVERQAVDDHVAGCPDCARLLAEQRAAAKAYAAYPVEAAEPADFQRVWAEVQSRLPAPAKRVTLEDISGLDVSEEFLEDEPPVATEPPQSAEPAETPGPETQTPAAAEGDQGERPPEKAEAGRVPPRPKGRPPVFKPHRMPRGRHGLWAHLAGIAAAALIVAAVLISVRPTIRVDQFATNEQVVIDIDMAPTGAAAQPVIVYLESDGRPTIPMVWVAGAPDEPADGKEDSVQ